MLDEPLPEDLLAAVAKLLRDEIGPALSGAPAFKVRVAANAIDLVERQLRQSAAADCEEEARLVALLGEAGSLRDLNHALAGRLREGAGEAELPGVTAHLWQTTLAKIAIDQPHYPGRAHARALLEGRPAEPEPRTCP